MTLPSLRSLCERMRKNVLTHEQRAAIDAAVPLLVEVAEISAKRPNKMGPHYMIWMDKMDAALTALRDKEKEGKL